MIESDRSLYYLNKYTPLLIGLNFLWTMIEKSISQEIDFFGLAGLSLLVVAFFYMFYRLTKVLVNVKISSQRIIISERIEIPWSEIKHIEYRWYKLYELDLGYRRYVFPPKSFSFFDFFGNQVITDDFDELILKKKKELKI